MTEQKIVMAILSNCVIHCHKCGNTVAKKEVPAIYLGERLENNQLWKIFYFHPTFNCENCGTLLTTVAILNTTREEAMENYEMYKKVNTISTGRVQ